MRPVFPPEHRCACGKLLFKGVLLTSVIELKCRFCHRINKLYGIDGKVQERVTRYTLLLDILNGIRIVEISPSASDILGYSNDELLSMTAHEIDPILGSGGYDHLWRSKFQDFRKGFRVNSVQRKKNGELIPVQALTKFIFTDIRSGAYKDGNSFTLPDLPALSDPQKSNEMKFPSLQELVRNLWCKAGIRPYAYVVVDCFEEVSAISTPSEKLLSHFSLSADLDGTCIYTTPNIQDILGHTQAEMLGNFIFDYFATKDRDKHRARFLSAVQGRSPFRTTIAFQHKNQRLVKCDTCFLPRQDESGLLSYYEGVCWK